MKTQTKHIISRLQKGHWQRGQQNHTFITLFTTLKCKNPTMKLMRLNINKGKAWIFADYIQPSQQKRFPKELIKTKNPHLTNYSSGSAESTNLE